MAIYHLTAKVVSRGIGRSAVAASAYLSCSKMYNDYDGIQHDYTRKRGLIHQEVMLPPHAPPEWTDREKLWNAVEETEKTKDSRLAREFDVALPVELNKEQWLELLHSFIQEDFVDIGMCADFAIHDPHPPGHNPHAHIMLTVRPLNEDGSWQYKTEKEYLCMKDGEERGFTSAEFKIAQKDGWEKQYAYNVGGKKVYMTPSAAQAQGYERINKHPKSTKFGRQNPITERWNSDEQLILWRSNWAEATNQILKKYKINSRIDHRSFAERGITEQPTIHEGVSARMMEKKGVVAERCEINRQIKADNKLLKELKKQVDKLTKAVKESLPAIAEVLENIRGHMILLQYHLLHNRMQTTSLKEQITSTAPILKEYQSTKNKLREKKTEKKALIEKQKQTSFFSPLKQIKLSQQLTTITEDIEELKFQKEQLMYQLYCHSETEMKQTENAISQMNKNLEKLEVQKERLTEQLAEDTERFQEIKSHLSTEQSDTLLDERITIRETVIPETRSKLQNVFGNKFEHSRLRNASEMIDTALGEDSTIFRERAIQKYWEQEQNHQKNQHLKPKKKSRDYER